MDHDHNMVTHSAKCDEEGCKFVGGVHAHDDDTAIEALSLGLAEHNKEVHDKETKAEEIKDTVKAKMKVL